MARCLVAATGSVLALIIVEALRTSKAVTAATCAGSALVFVGAYFAKEMDKGLTVTVTKPGATAPDVPPTRVGMQGTPSDKELTRLEAIRQILLEEFMEEEARLAAAEENKKSEVLRLEAIYETRIKTLGREITILKNKNAELSVFAGKAASHDSLKQRAETEIATLKKTHDAEISALKAQISGLEATIADVEAKMAAERAAMAEQLRAARGQYTAQKALFDSEMRKYRAALSLAAQHTEWWKAESRRIERDAAEKRDALESWHAKQMSSKVESERKGAQATFERELASLRASHEAEMESAVAQALGERNALQTLMDERLEDAERRREADIISAVRAAVAGAETKVAAEWRLKVEKVEAINKNIAKTFAREAERQSAEAKRATDAERAARSSRTTRSVSDGGGARARAGRGEADGAERARGGQARRPRTARGADQGERRRARRGDARGGKRDGSASRGAREGTRRRGGGARASSSRRRAPNAVPSTPST